MRLIHSLADFQSVLRTWIKSYFWHTYNNILNALVSIQQSDSSKSLKGFKVHFRRANPTTTSTTTTTTRRTTTLASSNSNNQIPSSDGDSEQASDNQPSDRNNRPSDETENDETENVAVQCQINGYFYEIGTILSPICPVGYQPSGNIKEIAHLSV